MKRAANSSNAEPSSSRKPPKKTRILDPSEDPANFAEQVDEALEDPTANRRGRVKNEGYESDSSDDGEGVVYSRKKDAEKDDDDDDMFAVGEKEETEEPGGKKKKEKKFMRLGDIEGQEFQNSDSEGGLSDEEDEPEDEDDAERRKKAGMGFEMSSFNMREEMEEGKFTEEGDYVRSFDPHAVHDRWMEGLDEKEIKQARRRKKHQERVEKEKALAEEQERESSGGKPAIEKELLSLLKKGETVLEALQRLGVEAKRSKSQSKGEKANGDSKPSKGTSPIEHVTHLATALMDMGNVDIYSMTYEELVRSVRSSGTVDNSWEPPSADKKFEYKWDAPGAGQTTDPFGPFSEEEMRAWFKAAYFGAAGEKVKIREVGGEWGDWSDILP
ncbi:hypothetical protein V5O48_000475 [Marasmius crinis-equi]|uniref:GYF domain-containing protein n=1 Tax=Marasmius crinis-equi TaxID=585013 RepID=A0ABR3G129_9AGAR